MGMYIAKTGDADKPLAAAAAGRQCRFDHRAGQDRPGPGRRGAQAVGEEVRRGAGGQGADGSGSRRRELKVVVQTKDEKVAAVPIAVETKVELAKNWFGTFGTTYEPVKKNVGFSLGISGTVDALTVQVKANYLEEETKTKYGGGADLTWKPTAGVAVTGGASANRIDESLRNPMTGLDDKVEQRPTCG